MGEDILDRFPAGVQNSVFKWSCTDLYLLEIQSEAIQWKPGMIHVGFAESHSSDTACLPDLVSSKIHVFLIYISWPTWPQSLKAQNKIRKIDIC